MSQHEISRFPVPAKNELAEDLQQIWGGAEQRFGFVPNVVKALSHRPEQLRAFLAYNEALTAKDTNITAADREMLIVAFSSKNGCLYCVQSHGAALRGAQDNAQLADQVAINYREADITPRQKAMIEFGLKLTNNSAAIEQEDFVVLREHGFTDEDIWDIAAVTAFYNMSNRMITFLAVRPDDEFYMMGRK